MSKPQARITACLRSWEKDRLRLFINNNLQ